ncbi:MAG: SDR family oxidoreductase [Gemmatimonadaceae bacterium]|nr:SDR family oxidoreductase [Gemmatimonadaceae bacterium]
MTLTRGLAKELTPRRIAWVTCRRASSAPRSTTRSPSRRSAKPSLAGREGRGDDVVNAVAFLASDAAAYITRESLEINGGLYFT